MSNIFVEDVQKLFSAFEKTKTIISDLTKKIEDQAKTIAEHELTIFNLSDASKEVEAIFGDVKNKLTSFETFIESIFVGTPVSNTPVSNTPTPIDSNTHVVAVPVANVHVDTSTSNLVIVASPESSTANDNSNILTDVENVISNVEHVLIKPLG